MPALRPSTAMGSMRHDATATRARELEDERLLPGRRAESRTSRPALGQLRCELREAGQPRGQRPRTGSEVRAGTGSVDDRRRPRPPGGRTRWANAARGRVATGAARRGVRSRSATGSAPPSRAIESVSAKAIGMGLARRTGDVDRTQDPARGGVADRGTAAEERLPAAAVVLRAEDHLRPAQRESACRSRWGRPLPPTRARPG